MVWIVLLIVAAIIVAFLLFTRISLLPVKTALTHLQQGALIVDVRTNAEFQAHHLSNALHIPLDELDSLAPRRLKDKDRVLLLHSETGRRGHAALRRFAELGYTRVFNLGSYTRAARIVGSK
jgi:phage shock protein E